MGCFNSRTRTASPPRPGPPPPTNREETTVLQIPGAAAHLLAPEGAAELARGDLSVFLLTEDQQVLATIVKVGRDLQWPLTRDEPVVKLDGLHYLFTLPDEAGGFLNYGVSFGSGQEGVLSAKLDSFLKENACFTAAAAAPPAARGAPRSSSGSGAGGGYWRGYASRIDDFNGVLARAVEQGTLQVVQGIFTYTDAYANQVQKGANLMQSQAVNRNDIDVAGKNSAKATKTGSINHGIRRVRKLSEMTEKMSRSLLNGVVTVSGAVSTPLVRSKAGNAILGSVPGQVLLASLNAINTVMDAIEAAERKSLAATGGAFAGVVSKRFGDNAGQATEDAFATVGHCTGTAWNIFKIRKAITPTSSVSSSLVKNAIKKKK